MTGLISKNASKWLVLVLSIFLEVSSDSITSRFAGDYFPSRIVHQIVAFGCWEVHESGDFSRSLMNRGIKVSYVPIREGLDMQRILKVNYYRLGIFVDFDCPKSGLIFDQFCEQRLRYNESYWWLIATGQKSVPKDFFGNLPLNIATEMTAALRVGESYELYDIYNPSYSHGARLNVTFMGRWTTEFGLRIELTQYKYIRRGNLHGLTLNSSVALDHSPEHNFMTYLSTPTDPGFDTMHRFNYGLIVQLKDYYNFTLAGSRRGDIDAKLMVFAEWRTTAIINKARKVQPDSFFIFESIHIKRGSTWGYLLPDGSYNGILGDMSKGLVDISVTPFQYKKDRLDVVEYTVQTWIARVCLIFRHPQKNELSNVFLKPFDSVVWYWITVAATVNWLLLYFTVRVEQHYDWREPVNTLDTNPASEVGLIAIAAVCQQGLSDGPRIYSGRIVFLFLFLWALLMFQFYSASVVGSLLVEKPRYITTPQHVLDSNLAVGSEDIAYNHDFFATTDDPAIKGIFNKKMAVDKKRKKRPFFSPEEGLKMVKKGGFAFQVDTATAYKIIEETFEENEICELQEIYLFEPKHTSTGVARHSPFKKMVTYGMRQIMERGTAKRLRNIWAHRRPQCPESHSSSPVPVVIEEFSPALLLLIFGNGLALFVMFIEKLVIHYSERRSNGESDFLQHDGTSNGEEEATRPNSQILYPNELA